MPARVSVYQVRNHHRSEVICEAIARGIKRAGDRVVRQFEHDYTEPDTEIAVFYGLEGKLPKIFRDYRLHGLPAVYIDLGYWGRRQGGRWSGYHKIVVGDRHPTAYFQARRHDGSRARALGVDVQPWRIGAHILIAGMGSKGARAEGFTPEQWERDAIDQLRQHTRRRIVYRPKPSWKGARPIRGVDYSAPTDDLRGVLEGCHAVVTHHSNVAVDALVAGIPAFSWAGVSQPMTLQDLSRIETPLQPGAREQWVADVAWCQWSVAEMAEGLPWRHLKAEALVP